MTDVPLRVRVEFDDRAVRAGIDRLKRKSAETGTVMKKSFSGGAFAIRGIATEMNNALRGLVIGLTAVTAAGTLLARQAVNWSAEFEVLKITFETLTGSVIVADNLIREMKDFAVRTPLQLRDVEEAGTTLLAFGEAAQDVIPILSNLGQAAVALNKPLEQFIRARNLLSQGVVLSRTLAPLGISRDILTQFGAGAGATGAELVAAFDKALRKYEGLFERTFDTIRGRMSNLKDELAVMFAAIGDPMRDIIISTVDQIRGLLGEVKTFFEQNKFLIQESFLAIKTAAESYLKPVIDILSEFLNKIKENPQYIRVVTDTFIKLATAATNLLIIGTLTTAFISFTATIVLLKLSLPVVMATFGIAPGVIARTTVAVKGLTTSVISLKGAMIGLQAAVPYLAVLTVAILVIRDAWIEVEKAFVRYQQRLMGVQAGMAVVGEGEMGAISALRGIAGGEVMTDAEKRAAWDLYERSGFDPAFKPPGAWGPRPPIPPVVEDEVVITPGGGELIKSLSIATRHLLALGRHLKTEIRARAEVIAALMEEREARKLEIIAARESKIDAVAAYQLGLIRDKFIPKPKLTEEERMKQMVKALGFDTMKEYLESLKDVSNEFMNNLSRTLGNFLAQWGAQGGAPDIRGAGMRILQPAATQWGIDLAAKWNTGGFMAGPIAGLIMGGAGFIANRLIGEEPLKIEQPVDIRIVDIETRLKNFFNFRGLDPFTYRSSFQEAFENGEY